MFRRMFSSYCPQVLLLAGVDYYFVLAGDGGLVVELFLNVVDVFHAEVAFELENSELAVLGVDEQDKLVKPVAAGWKAINGYLLLLVGA